MSRHMSVFHLLGMPIGRGDWLSIEKQSSDPSQESSILVKQTSKVLFFCGGGVVLHNTAVNVCKILGWPKSPFRFFCKIKDTLFILIFLK